MGVFENTGTLFRCPCNKDPTIQGTILGSPIFGNLQIPSPDTATGRTLTPWEQAPQRQALTSHKILARRSYSFEETIIEPETQNPKPHRTFNPEPQT